MNLQHLCQGISSIISLLVGLVYWYQKVPCLEVGQEQQLLYSTETTEKWGENLNKKRLQTENVFLLGVFFVWLLVLNTTEAAQEVDTSNNNKHVEWGSTGSTPIER